MNFFKHLATLSLILIINLNLHAAEYEKIELQWFGQSAFKITNAGKVILIDPYLTQNPKTPEHYKNLDNLGKIDLILISHAHGDHVGDAVALSKKNQVPVYAPAGLNSVFNSLNELPENLTPKMNKGGTVAPFGSLVKISMVHAEHSSEYSVKDPSTGKTMIHPGGEPVGFLLEFENGFKIYHMGDTALFGDMKIIGEKFKPDLILIPIGGNFTMDPKAAAEATKDYLKPKMAIPMHYGTTPLLKGTPEEYIKALGDSPTKVMVMQPGEKLTF